MIYFDNAATSFPKAPGVTEAITRFINESAANPGRAGHRMAVAAEQMLDEARLKLTRFFDADDHHRMVFALNTTDALNMGLKCVLASFIGKGEKPHVITTVMEHNSVSRPLVAMELAGQIELTRLVPDEEGFISPELFKAAIKPSTRLIVMTHASNVLGTIQDVASVGAIARAADVLFMLDAAQTAGVIPVSVKQMNIDLLAFPGHKSLLGPTGTGGLYIGKRCPMPATPATSLEATADLDRYRLQSPTSLRPWREGGTGGDSSTPTMPALFPYFLEGGTPNTIGIVGLSAAVDFVVKHGVSVAAHHEQKMVQAIIDRFADDERFKVHGTRDASRRVGTVSLSVHGFEPSDLASILDDSFEIAVRPGLHCSPYMHKHLGTFPSGTLRVSPGVFNTDEQLAQLIDALDQIAS
jgi:selenocysteine lyase/cysteine desulfurase